MSKKTKFIILILFLGNLVQSYMLLFKGPNHSYHLEEDQFKRINRITGYLKDKDTKNTEIKHGIDLKIFWEKDQVEFVIYENGIGKRFFDESK